MKTLKVLTLSLAAAVALVGTASAQTVVKIAGSTAFRAGASTSIINYLAIGGHTVYAGYTSSTSGLTGSNNQIFANGTIGAGGSATTIVEASWTGSLAGVVDMVAVASDHGAGYIDPSTMGTAAINAVNATPVTNPTTTSPGGGGLLTGANAPTSTPNGTPDMAMSDAVNTTIANEIANSGATMSAPVGAYSTLATLAAAVKGSTVVDSGTGTDVTVQTVGVVPFEWCVGNITTSSDIPTNIDQQTAHSLISIGYVAQSQLTGTNNAADSTNYFYYTGRNEDSGTRIEYLAECQNGVTAPLIQYAINGNPSNGNAPGGAVTNAYQFPITALFTEPNIVWNAVGHSGYASGSSSSGVGFALEGAESNTPFAFSDGSQAFQNTGASYFLSSLGVPDATKSIALGAKPLTYNGVPFSVSAVQNGQYTAWSYEHCYHLNTVVAAKATIINGIADVIFNSGATGGGAGILYNSMNVSRALTEGGIITHN